MLLYEDLSNKIIRAYYNVLDNLGEGFLEKVYENAMCIELEEMGIPFERRAARQITPNDYNKYDYLVAMDDENIYYMNRCWAPDPQNKIVRLLSFAGKTRDIADPWYTGNFDQTYEDIVEGCTAFLEKLIKIV